MAVSRRHTEFFGPDLGRGPFAAHRIETAVIQIATALAQVRAPLSRSDSDLQDHADFIRNLADRLAPDWASQITMDVGDEVSNEIQTSIRTAVGIYSLLHCWLADTPGGGETSAAPGDVVWNSGTVLETVSTLKRYWIITPSTGVANVTVTCTIDRTWYWAVARYGRVYYSSSLNFDA
ncbi:MAG TPA: hypothetical protein VM487_21305 [Phycisphaerae bacterium]|nr:hypothetical protein [Phycisphaerae bacterium]